MWTEILRDWKYECDMDIKGGKVGRYKPYYDHIYDFYVINSIYLSENEYIPPPKNGWEKHFIFYLVNKCDTIACEHRKKLIKLIKNREIVKSIVRQDEPKPISA